MPSTLIPRRPDALQHRDDDRNHRRREAGGTGEAQVNDDQESGEDRQDEQRTGRFQSECADDGSRQPGRGVGGEQRRTESDADAEQRR